MPPDSTTRDTDAEPAWAGELSTPPRVLLFMQSGRDRELLSETLRGRYHVETSTDVETLDTEFDCCVFDYPEFNRVAGTVQYRRDTASPVFLPYVLLVGEHAVDASNTEAWDYVDDVVELPVNKDALLSRIGNLVERRRTAAQLAERERELQATIEDLKLKEQAMDEAPVGITIAEPGDGNDPLVYVNDQFQTLTGYSSDIIGSDCRFLQGDETDEETRATIREAIDHDERVSVDILNYRKNGQKFWNKVDIAPVRNAAGVVTNYVGFQTDITERKIRERRMEVMNRVLSHNLRNKMNVIEGHVALLQEEYIEGEAPDSLTSIANAASNLLGLAETVKKIERTVSGSSATGTVFALDDRMEALLSGFEDRFPEASFDLTIPTDDPLKVAVTGLTTAIQETVENAVVHNDAAHPAIEIRISRRDVDWIDIAIEDNGPGIPEREIQVLREGETALDHADRLGLWLTYWVVNKAGGNFAVEEADPRGTIVTLSVPAADQEP